MKTLQSALMATALVLTIGFITTSEASAREFNRDSEHMNRANHSRVFDQQKADHYGIKKASSRNDEQYMMNNRDYKSNNRSHRGSGSCWR